VASVFVDVVADVLDACRAQKLVLRTAESCTAGGLAAAIASVAGASDVLDCGWITYSNDAKINLLGVPQDMIEKYGAVSEEVVCAMAQGGASKQALCVAISGIAGPGGGSVDKPVGTVWIAIALHDAILKTQCFHLVGSRSLVQSEAIHEALMMLKTVLKA